MAADTSSAPAASIAVVGAAATALASLSAEPIFVRSVAAATTISGATTTYDIAVLLPGYASTWRKTTASRAVGRAC
ncbi:hypothetical protein NIIDMKKI_69610 [Mycobacterium kansasii]|uniref:Uncharacterized protein n=1 Tax=Mycobacterium kansasii TaxID=1768 RepID=A0A7G1IPQ5_MYCKA|nr:hypothetical protein NIIDMKKI_69610 [Mycobacterium kansasii]VAZ58377.1 hypothetical protein LAUMK22_00164 [Mycobacterium kansasii]VAZ64773.1 hypothetical protein LAUMK40_00893 [Mycobacterium kansasii]